jgi:hypothetical protein
MDFPPVSVGDLKILVLLECGVKRETLQLRSGQAVMRDVYLVTFHDIPSL